MTYPILDLAVQGSLLAVLLLHSDACAENACYRVPMPTRTPIAQGKNAHPCVPHEWAWAVHSYQSYVARAPILPIHPGVIVSFFVNQFTFFFK